MAIEYFPRRPVTRPSTRVQTDTSALTGAAIESDKSIMMIGAAEGGRPNTVYRVRNIIQAKEIFRGGELLDALEMAWNPSSVSAGGGTILAMRVEDAVAGTLVKEGVTFKSKVYGKSANDVEVRLYDRDLDSVKTLQVKNEEEGYNKTYPNIGDIITISKTDDEDAPTYLGVEVTEDKLTVFTGDAEPDAAEKTFKLGSGTYRNANVLATSINSIKGVEAKMPSGGNKNINTRGLDPVAKDEITDEQTITAMLADMHNQLQYDEFLEIELTEEQIDRGLTDKTSVVVKGGTELTDFELEKLSGGDMGDVPETWSSKFNKLANEGGYYLVPLTDSEAIHAEATAFVGDRAANGEPMRVITGAGFNETPQKLLGRAAALRDPRTMLIGFSGKVNLADGRVTEVPAYMYAAQVAGIASGLPIGEAITFKNIRLTDLAEIYDTDQMDDLNNGGVVMAEFVRNRDQTHFRLVDDVTTYNDQSDPVRSQMGIGEGSDFLTSELKVMLDENYIGTSVVNMSASLIKNSVQSFLDQKRRDNEIQDYSPEDVQVVINGEVANISLVVYPIRSLKRIEVALVYRQQIIEA